MTHDDRVTSGRLRELLRMRRFLDLEIAAERQRLAGDCTADLIRAAGDLYGATLEEICSPIRGDGDVIHARMMACWLLRAAGLSFPEIGRRVNRDHSTVMHACRRIESDPPRLALARSLFEQEAAA